MRVFAIVSAVLIAALAGCGGLDDSPGHQAEWREVLRHKRAAAEPGAPPERKQVWADAVRGFVEKHPEHSRARQVWTLLQLEFADDLRRIGRAHQAAVFYRAVLDHDPDNEHALRGWEAAAARLAVTPGKLRSIVVGMPQREVASKLGRPLPGWTHHVDRPSASFDSWYYRTAQGVAAIHFREGRVIAVEENSNARLARIGS